MLIGSDGTGWIDFADYELARTIGVIALALILFEGGLASGWGEIGPVAAPGGPAGLHRHDRHGGDDRARGRLAVRLLHARGPAAGVGAGCHRRGGRLLGPADVDPAAPPGPHARGRVGDERPRRRPARAGLHPVDPEPGLRARRHGLAVRGGPHDRPRGRPCRRLRGRGAAAAQPPRERRVVPGGHARDRGRRLRGLGGARRVRVPGGLPGRARARLGPASGQAHRGRLPRGPVVGRAARHVLHARPARVPERPGQRRFRGDHPGDRRRGDRAPAGGIRGDGVRALHAPASA